MAGAEVARRISEAFPNAVTGWNATDVYIQPETLPEVARFLKETPDLDFSFLVAITAVDYIEYFELVYHLRSLRRNHSIVLKTRCHGRDGPSAPSLVSLWQGADLQEREVWDLMGIRFDGHPNMKRIMLWEGFPGHPLRKDFLE